MNTTTIEKPQPTESKEVVMSRKIYDHLMSFVGTVSLMRTAQKEFFATKNTGKLMLAKGYEEDVDAYLEASVWKPVPSEDKPDTFNEDKIGQLIQAKVATQKRIEEYKERLQGIDVHDSDAAKAIHENLRDLEYDLTYVNNDLIREKEAHKTFLQNRLTKYRHELDMPREPHLQEELSHLINQTVRKIGDLDIELKNLRA